MFEPEWVVVLSPEVSTWLEGLNDVDAAMALRAIRRLREQGPFLKLPHSRPLAQGLRELRFSCGDVEQRITYYMDPKRRAITLTTFRKQRQNERREVQRGIKAMKRHKEGS